MTGRTYSVALAQDVHEALVAHLLRDDGQEDLCFAVWYPSKGATRTTALLVHPILPLDGERRVHGNASFLPPYFARAISEAMRLKGGLAFLHSHGGPRWQDMSLDDVHAEQSHAAQAQAATGLPFVGLTLGTDGAWSARFWPKTAPRTYTRNWCESVRVVGQRLTITWHPLLRPAPAFRTALKRTTSAWGNERQAEIARLRIGIIGAGSVGSMIAEALVRTGVERVDLIDFDAVEEHNLDRLLHANEGDIGRAKVQVLADALRRSATAGAPQIQAIEWSIVEEQGYRAALDCDVLFSCVDRPWPRSVMNHIAYAHLIPVVDGGIRVTLTRRGMLKGADWRAHVAAPGRRCLECVGQYNAGDVSVERDGYFDDPSYIEGLPADHGLRANENVFGFSMASASLEILQFLMMVVAPLGISSPGAQLYHFVPGMMDPPDTRACQDNCSYPPLAGHGDTMGLVVTGRHPVAERARALRQRTATPQPTESHGRFWDRVVALARRLF